MEREARANLVYRDFTRVGAAKMPDAKTMVLGCSDGADRDPSVGHQCHRRKAATWATPCRYRPMDARNQPCPASTHCWSGWLGHGKRG